MADAPPSFEETNAALAGLRREIDAFAANARAWITTSKSQHDAVLVADKENLARAQLAYQHATQSEITLSEQRETERAEAAKLAGEIKDVKEHKSELETRHSALRAEAEALRAKLATEQQALETKKRQRQERSQKSKHAIEFFVDRLGLSLVKAKDGSLSLIFNKIDPYHLDKTYIFTIRLNSHNEFELVSCHPQLPNALALVEALRRENNMSEFVKGVRVAFRATV